MNDRELHVAPVTQRAFRLIEEHIGVADRNDDAWLEMSCAPSRPNHISSLNAVHIPDGVSFLEVTDDEVKLSPRVDGADGARRALVAFEATQRGGQPMLMMVSEGEPRPRVNGMTPPRLTVLRERDQISFADRDLLLHVTGYVKAYIGGPPESLCESGAVCALCSLPFAPDTQVYVCPYCQNTMHMETNEHKSGDRPLACVTPGSPGSACVSCGQPIVADGEAYTWLPDEVLNG